MQYKHESSFLLALGMVGRVVTEPSSHATHKTFLYCHRSGYCYGIQEERRGLQFRHDSLSPVRLKRAKQQKSRLWHSRFATPQAQVDRQRLSRYMPYITPLE